MNFSTCISRCSRAECYVLMDQLFEECLFLDGSSVKNNAQPSEKIFLLTCHRIEFGGTGSLLYKVLAEKNWPSEVGKKIFGMPNHSREREPCNVPSPYPPWHITSVMCHGTERIRDVPRRYVPWHITDVMCQGG